ncbi:MAG: aspartate aminotransferase [Halieaceae bacterium]|jgi:aspartate aminotransferase
MIKNRPFQFTPSSTLANIPVSATLRINEQVCAMRAAGESVFHMGFGESPFPVPEPVKQALFEHAGDNSYPPSKGLAVLCDLATSYFAPRLGFEASGIQAIVGPGSKDLIFALQMAIEGDLLLPTPSWVSYEPQASLAGSSTVRIACGFAGAGLSGEILERAIVDARASGLNPSKLILNYPNNPTGLGYSSDTLASIASVCRRLGIIVISDEIYGLVAHGGKHQSIAHFYPEGTVVTSGLSKHLSLGGYRLGFAFIPDSLTKLFTLLETFASETWSGVCVPAQQAAVVAVQGTSEIEQHIALCSQVHGLISNYGRDRLSALNIDYPPLAGGFYLFPNFDGCREGLAEHYGVSTSEDLALDLLERASLAALPGADFGESAQVLALRLALTDYDGSHALDVIRQNPDIGSDDFATVAAPNMVAGFDALAGYLRGCG